MSTLIERMRDEADQCANDGASDIAKLLNEAASAMERLSASAASELQLAAHTALVLFESEVNHYRDGNGTREALDNARTAMQSAIDLLASQSEEQGKDAGPHRWLFTDEHGLECVTSVPPSMWNARSRNSRKNVTALFLAAPVATPKEGA